MVDRKVTVTATMDASGMIQGAKQAETAVERVGKAGKKAADDTESASRKQETAFSRMARSAQENEKAWTTAGTALAAFGAVTAAGLGASAKAAVDWESSFAGVKKTVDDSTEGYAALSDELREMARTLPASHAEIAAVAEAAGQLGVAREDITDFTRVMIDLGETTNLSADAAATSIAQIANVMGTGGDDIDNFASALVALGNAGASTEGDILDLAQRLAGAGQMAGASEADVLALAAAMADVGIQAQLGGGAMSRAMIDMNSAVKEGGDDLAEFARVSGMTASEFAAQWNEDPVTAVQAFVQGLANIQQSGGDAAGALADVGLKGTENAQVFLRLTGNVDGMTNSLELSKQAWADNSALADEAGQRYETVASQLQVAKNNVVDAGISLGEVFLPAISAAAEGIQGFAGFLAGLPQEVQALAGAAGAAASTVGLLGGGFLLMAPRVLETKKAFEDLGKISPRMNTALSTMGTITMAGGVLVGGLVAIGGALGAIQRATKEAIPSVEEFTSALLDMNDAGGIAEVEQILADLDIRMLGVHKWRGPIDDFGSALDRVLDPSFVQRGEALDRALSFGQIQTSGDQVMEFFGQLDSAIAGLVTSGNADIAAEQIERLWLEAEGRGYDREAFLELFPQYSAALAGLDNNARLAADGLEVMNEAVSPEDIAQQEEAAAAAKALAEYLGEIAGQSGAFVSFGTALSNMQAKSQEWAQSQADATDTADDSWEDFYDGQSVNVDEWIAELERMVQAQADWETNMVALSGRVSQTVLDELMRLGPEGAPLVAELVNASEEELARLEEVMAQGGAEATGAFAEGIGTGEGQALMDAAFQQLGQKAYNTLAAELASGQVTVQEAISKYDIKMPVDLEIEEARAKGLALAAEINTTDDAVMPIDANPTQAKNKQADLLREVNTTTGTVPVDADPTQAKGKQADLLRSIDTSTGTVTVDGNPGEGRGALFGLLGEINRSGGTVGIGANAGGAYAVLRGFLNSIPSSVSVALRAIPLLGGIPGFMAGGYTGNFGASEPVGIVHGQEFVSTASTVADPANRAALEYMHDGGSMRSWAPPASVPQAEAQQMLAGVGAGAGPVPPINVSVQVDGREIARAAASGSAQLGGRLNTGGRR